MLIVLTVVGILLTVLFVYLDDNEGGSSLFIACVSGIATVTVAIVMIFNISVIVNGNVIDQKIAMYQEENANIETQIANCVTEYQQYESKIISEVTSENAMTLISLYPDLKSDTLVAMQIENYIANNNAIRSLKEDKLDIQKARWWVYFGS